MGHVILISLPAEDSVSIVLYAAVSKSQDKYHWKDRESSLHKDWKSGSRLHRSSSLHLGQLSKTLLIASMPDIHFDRFVTTRAANSKLAVMVFLQTE